MTDGKCGKDVECNKKNALAPDTAGRLTAIAASGVTGRGPSSLCRDDVWSSALELIVGSCKIAVVSGFYVPSASSPETDGPSGSLVLARAISRFGREAEVWTDGYCLGCYKACADVLGFPSGRVLDASADGFAGTADLLIYVERLGRAADGEYYNMHAEDISAWTHPFDRFAESEGVASIGIGDGGNEVGMGCLLGDLRRLMPGYAPCLCVVRTDVCVPVDVSNWGAYAVASALSSFAAEWLGQTVSEERLMLEALSHCGAVDGVSKKREVSVDGLPLARHLDVARSLRSAVGL